MLPDKMVNPAASFNKGTVAKIISYLFHKKQKNPALA